MQLHRYHWILNICDFEKQKKLTRMKSCFIFYSSVLLASQRLILIYFFYRPKHFVETKNGKNGFQQILLQHLNCSLAKQKVPDWDSTFKDPHFFLRWCQTVRKGIWMKILRLNQQNTEACKSRHMLPLLLLQNSQACVKHTKCSNNMRVGFIPAVFAKKNLYIWLLRTAHEQPFFGPNL